MGKGTKLVILLAVLALLFVLSGIVIDLMSNN